MECLFSMRVTIENLTTCKKRLTTLACRLAHQRDTSCAGCGRRGNLQAHHLRTRGANSFFAASDPANIVLVCTLCHDEIGAGRLKLRTPGHYGTRQANTTNVQERADWLIKQARQLGVEIP